MSMIGKENRVVNRKYTFRVYEQFIKIIFVKNDERFIKKVSDELALSTGSACSAGEPSYVIKAIGLEKQVSKVIRITINKYTTEEDIQVLLSVLKENI